MLKNYFRTALRNISKNKLYSFLNIAGLAIGIACCMLILLYVQDELSFDRFHENADRIYRLVPTFKTSERTMLMGTTAHAQAPMLQDEYPEIENYVRFTSYGGQKIIEYADRRFNEEKFLHVDQSFFEVFSFNLIKGNRLDALVNPYSIVITEEMALKYFGNEDPLGKQLKINAKDLYQVTGVLENIPQNSHIRPDFFGSFSTLNLKAQGNAVMDLLNSINYYTYLQLRSGVDSKLMEEKFISFIDKHIGVALKQLGGEARLEMQPLTSIHLHSKRENELERNSDITYIYLFSGIGLFILLLACLNFMNLATARSANRAKEVGLRKVVGAHRGQLVKQFLGESFLLTFISLVLSLLLVYLMLPLFQNIAGKHLNSDMLGNPLLFGGLAVLLLFIGFVGGSYPAFFLSAFKPVDVLQGKFKRGAKSSLLRIVLVSLQFTVSIVLIIGTLVVNRQLNYIQNKNLGYDKDHVVTIRVRNGETMNQIDAIRSEFLKNPMVLNVSASSTPPIGISDFSIHHAVGKPPDEQIMLSSQMVDEHFLDTYKIELVAGRNFSNEYP
ncbi:MAG: ABC transporter permease, partial [Candidatus Aminicenantes bacterium]|nr:ABC transporter permease [Candidatus Aminicenantes bacterium]